MKDDHLTLRLPRALARTLSRWARERGVTKSSVVREAVARYLARGPGSAEPPAPTVSALELAARWPVLPRLTPEEGAALDADIAAARRGLPEVRGAWE